MTNILRLCPSVPSISTYFSDDRTTHTETVRIAQSPTSNILNIILDLSF